MTFASGHSLKAVDEIFWNISFDQEHSTIFWVITKLVLV